MPKFELFEKSNKMYWSINTIIYSIFFFLFSLLFIKDNFLLMKESSFDKGVYGLLIFTMLFGLILKIMNYSKMEHLRGKLYGYLVFDESFIQVKQEIIPLDTINNIKISNTDYIGKLINVSSGNFGPALSNGTRNFLILYFETGKPKQYQFQLINSNDFQDLRTLLIHYFIKRKIEFWELAQILGERSCNETTALTKEIEEIASLIPHEKLRF